jgi:hypothetical protein
MPLILTYLPSSQPVGVMEGNFHTWLTTNTRINLHLLVAFAWIAVRHYLYLTYIEYQQSAGMSIMLALIRVKKS